jgi:hypothetical protein
VQKQIVQKITMSQHMATNPNDIPLQSLRISARRPQEDEVQGVDAEGNIQPMPRAVVDAVMHEAISTRMPPPDLPFRLTSDQLKAVMAFGLSNPWSGDVSVDANGKQLLRIYLNKAEDVLQSIGIPRQNWVSAFKLIFTGSAETKLHSLLNHAGDAVDYDMIRDMLFSMLDGTDKGPLDIMSKLTSADALQLAFEQKGRNGRIADYFHAMEQVADLLTPPIDERTMIHCLWSGLPEPLKTQVANSFEGGVIQQHTKLATFKQNASAFNHVFQQHMMLRYGGQKPQQQLPRRHFKPPSPPRGHSGYTRGFSAGAGGGNRGGPPPSNRGWAQPPPPPRGPQHGAGGSYRQAGSPSGKPKSRIEAAVQDKFMEPTGSATSLYIRSLSKAAFEVRRKKNLCFLCGQKHNLAECPKKQQAFRNGSFFYYAKKKN